MSSILSRSASKLVHSFQALQHSHMGKMMVRPEEPTSLDDLYNRLKRNEIKELKLGFRESDFVVSKRSASQLEKALRVNTSVTSVSIGWRHKNRKALGEILKAIARHTKLVKLQLILDDWIPEHLLRMLLQNQSDTLVQIDIRAVQVKRKNALGRWCCEPDGTNISSSASWLGGGDHTTSVTVCDHCLVSRVLVPMHNFRQHQHRHLKSLHLVDCGLRDKQAVMLADYLHTRGGIAELSLRSNRQLGAHGVAVLCQSPVTQKLDLSLCDMNPKVAHALAPAIAARPWVLGELLLCGNYRMGADALLALVQQDCCSKVLSLNVSYCDVSDSRAVAMIRAVAKLDGPRTKLRKLSLQGAKIANSNCIAALVDLLKCNLPLRVIHLNDPGQPNIISTDQLRMVIIGMKQNFEVEELYMDLLFNTEINALWREIDFYFRLNRAGRRILLDNKPVERIEPEVLPRQPFTDWFDVLERAGDDLQVLYWIVRHSADRFEREYRP